MDTYKLFLLVILTDIMVVGIMAVGNSLDMTSTETMSASVYDKWGNNQTTATQAGLAKTRTQTQTPSELQDASTGGTSTFAGSDGFLDLIDKMTNWANPFKGKSSTSLLEGIVIGLFALYWGIIHLMLGIEIFMLFYSKKTS